MLTRNEAKLAAAIFNHEYLVPQPKMSFSILGIDLCRSFFEKQLFKKPSWDYILGRQDNTWQIKFIENAPAESNAQIMYLKLGAFVRLVDIKFYGDKDQFNNDLTILKLALS